MKKQKNKVIVGIMAGGGSRRLSPLSSIEMPKQFLKLYGNKTMLERTLDRAKKLNGELLVSTSESYEDLVFESIKIEVDSVVTEPCSKNTAAAVISLCEEIFSRYGSCPPTMVIMPSDHYIENEEAFICNINVAIGMVEADKDKIITLGVKPTNPSSEYGYIEAGELTQAGKYTAYKVNKFREKPGARTAKKYLAKGNFFWNSGIYVFNTERIIRLFRRYMPDHFNSCFEMREDRSIGSISCKFSPEKFNKLKPISFDKGIIQKNEESLLCLPVDCGWNDLGALESYGKFLREWSSQGGKKD